MNGQTLTVSAETSHSLQSVESHVKRLFQEIDLLVNEKKEVENVKKYTAEIKKKIKDLEAKIDNKKRLVQQCQIMLGFPPGCCVRNGTTTPGTVIQLVIAGQVPEVHVRWAGTTISVPESPAKLTLVNPELVKYVWSGDRYPKLVRIIDGWECDEIEILEQCLVESLEDKEDPERRFKLTYCKKRIDLVNQRDLVELERAVRQGLQVFYRVGEALSEIRDRKLYKQHGYTDFRDYLREYWHMGKSKAYRLIESAEVMENIKAQESVHHGGQKKSVPNWGQNLPESEAVTRELAKLPPDQQAVAWEKAVETAPDNRPTASHTKAVVTEIINHNAVGNCPDKNCTTVQISSTDKPIINDFHVGQLVQIKSDRTDSRLVGYHLSIGVVTKVNPVSLDIKIWGQEFSNISPSDLEIVDEDKPPVICLAPSAEVYRILVKNLDSKEEILKLALSSIHPAFN
jgi:hypothetical protein